MGTIPNRGAAGSVLDATVTGLVRVEGPTVYNPGLNNLTAPIGDPAIGPATALTVVMDFGVGGFQQHNAARDIVRAYASNGWLIRISGTTHQFSLIWWDTALRSRTIGTAPPVGSRYVAITVVDEGGLGAFRLFYSDDGVTWTQSGVTVNHTGPFSYILSTSLLYIGFGGTESYVGTLSGVWIAQAVGPAGVPVDSGWLFEFTPDDIANAAPDATTIQTTSGHTLTAARPASGPVLTIVPGGVVYLNPDESSSRYFRILNWPYSLGEDEDVVMCAAFRTGAQTAGFPQMFGVYNGNDRIRMYRNPTSNPRTLLTEYRTPDVVKYVGGPLADTIDQERIPSFFAVRASRSEGTVTGLQIRSDGTENFGAILDASTVGAILTAGATFTALQSSSQVFTSGFYVQGPGVADDWDNDRFRAVAKQMLSLAQRPPRKITSDLPPAAPHVYGDRWRASNGHVALFNGSEWEAVNPLTGNVAVSLANMDLLIGGAE